MGIRTHITAMDIVILIMVMGIVILIMVMGMVGVDIVDTVGVVTDMGMGVIVDTVGVDMVVAIVDNC
jgi:hypothetical protein